MYPDFSNRLYHNNHWHLYRRKLIVRALKVMATVWASPWLTLITTGFPDIYVTGVNRNTLYHNNGDGTFTDVTEHAECPASAPMQQNFGL